MTFTFIQLILRGFHTEILKAPQVYLVFIQIHVLSSQPLILLFSFSESI